MSWLPNSASLAAGAYFFAVIVPGGQPDPNDGGAKNLSDTTPAPWNSGDVNKDGSSIPSGDLHANRTFTVDADGNISYGGTHNATGNNTPDAKIQMFPYDDTTNNGGVYILAVCSLADGYPVDPHSCKYDAFKVDTEATECIGSDCPAPPAFDLTAFKSATPTFTRTYGWDVSKSVDATKISKTSGSATFNYTVTAVWSGPSDSGWQVTGTIDVLNPNAATVAASVSDQITTDGTTNDANTTCTVYDPVNTTTALSNPYTLGENSDTAFPYTCTYGKAPAATSETNVATISWDAQTLSNSAQLGAGSTPATHAVSWSTPTTTVNAMTTVSDNFNSGGAQALGVAGVDGSWTEDAANHLTGFAEAYTLATKTFTLTYSRSIPVPAHGCLDYSNTATESTGTDPTTPDSVKVTVCRVPPATGALTMGFWQNKNGQAIITGQAKTGTCPSATWLRQFAPFQDLSATATCAGVAAYDVTVFKAATCSGPATAPCNAMLKAQMLATAFDVYFSDTALGGNKINASAPIGGINIDLQNICKMIDGTGGTATCSGTYEDVSSVFGGSSSLTVLQMLAFAASQSNPGGSVWYANVKANQVLAKDAFDAINNQVAFSI